MDDNVGLHGLSKNIISDCRDIAGKVAHEFKITGPFNMQIILERCDDDSYTLKVIECNLRASRSFPFVSKVLDTSFIDLATRAIMNHPSLTKIIPKHDLMTITRPYVAVKAPVFSWTRLAGADPMLGVEMASTGEVACFGRDVKEAMFTSYFSNHNNFKELPIPESSGILIGMDELTSIEELLYIAKTMRKMDYSIYTDSNKTRDLILSNGIDCETFITHSGNSEAEADNFCKVLSDRRQSREIFTTKQIRMVISLCRHRPRTLDRSYMLRRCAVDFGIGLLNESKTAVLLTQAMDDYKSLKRSKSDACVSWQEWLSK